MNKRAPSLVLLYGSLLGLAIVSPACTSAPESEKPNAGTGHGGKERTFGSPGEFAEQPNKTVRPEETVSTPASNESSGVLYGKPATSSDSLRKSDFKK